MAKQTIGLCELCGRQEVVLTEHHLTPKEEGGAFLPTAFLCIPCHKQVHALYTNHYNFLASYFHITSPGTKF